MSRWMARSQARQRFFTSAPGERVGLPGAPPLALRFSGTSGTASSARSAIPLLLPGVGVVVIPAGLPEAGLVVLHEPEAGDPLRALPEVEIGDEAAHGRAVLELERLAVEPVRDERVVGERLLEGDVRGEAVRGLEDDVAGL